MLFVTNAVLVLQVAKYLFKII